MNGLKKLLCAIEPTRSLYSVCLVIFFSAYCAFAQADTDNPVSFTEQEIQQLGLLGPWPKEPVADAGNEFSGLVWAQTVGRILFHDQKLSSSGELSCANCHIESLGFTDGRPVAIGAQAHVRNTQSLLDINQQRWFGWDGGTDSLWAASLRPLFFDVEMNNTVAGVASYVKSQPLYVQALKRSLGDQPLNNASDEQLSVNVAKFIAAYVQTISSKRTPFDLFRDAVVQGESPQSTQYSESAMRGLKTFLGEANCHVCHFGPNFSNGEFHDTGRSFFTGVGQVDAGRYTGIKRLRADPYNLLGQYNGTHNKKETRKTRSVKLDQSNWGQWRTPSLRHLSSTAPYLHDGSLGTLRQVVDSYADMDIDRLHADGESILQPLDLSDAQRNDVVEFLKSLSVPR